MGDNFDLLYAQPSFLAGVASVIDIGGTLQQYNESLTGEQADIFGLLSDVRALRQDLAMAREKLKAEIAGAQAA